jgi:glycosyltransferase involved in cell wall biosynthesis
MWLVILFIVIASALSVPAIVLFIETMAALNPFRDPLRKTSSSSALSKQVAVIIPAHNESIGVLPTLSDLKPQLQADDRLIVVADNCSDDTGVVASSASAEVLVRNDLSKVGKGYALAYAISHLKDAPPDFVLFIDADCRIQNDMVPRLKQMCLATGRPVQACFLMAVPSCSAVDHRIAEFFWLIRNWVRPLGLAGLGLPVQLMGTGMIFPWHVILKAPLAHGNLVEDLKLGLDLCAAGHPAVFYPFVVGTSEFPTTTKGTDSQRQRWIQGHLSIIATLVPRYLLRALLTRNLCLFALALDVVVPPFSLFISLLAGLLLLSSLFLLQGIPSPIIICSINCLTVFLALFLGWLRCVATPFLHINSDRSSFRSSNGSPSMQDCILDEKRTRGFEPTVQRGIEFVAP